MTPGSPRCRSALAALLAAAGLVFVLLPATISPAYAHRTRFWHRHPHRARLAVVVGAPVVLARPVVIAGEAHGAIDFDVEPSTTEVHVDGALRGQVDDFDGHPDKLYLRPGMHRIALVTPDGEKLSRRIRILAGHEINLKLDLEESQRD
jgi:hypothetical protein